MASQSTKVLLAVFWLLLPVFGKARSHGEKNDVPQGESAIRPGAVVHAIAKNSGAEKAGLQIGDVLLHWRRGDSDGEIESPFDVSEIEVEQKSRGNVAIEGLRGIEKRSWMLGPNEWGIKTRPNFTGTFLTAYLTGQQLAKTGKVSSTAQRWRAVLSEVQNHQQSSWFESWVLFHSAELFADAKDWKGADNFYEAAMQKAGDAAPKLLAQICEAWADTYKQRGDWPNVEKYYRCAEEQSEKSGTANLRQAKSINNLGNMAYELGDLSTAQEQYSRALAIREELAPGSLDVAATLNNLGNIADDLGDLAQAEDYQRSAKAITEKLAPGSSNFAASLSNLGLLEIQRGDLAQAERNFNDALAILRKLHSADSDFSIAALHTNLGLVAWKRGDLTRAEDHYLRALVFDKKSSSRGLAVARLLDNLGAIAQDRGQLAKAEKYHKQSLRVRETVAPNGLAVAESLHNLGDVARLRGDLAGAQRYFLQSLAIKEKVAPDSLRTARTLNNLGCVTRSGGDLEKAEEYYRRSLAIMEKLAPDSSDYAEMLAALASLFRENQQLDAAAKLYEKSLNALENQMERLGGAEAVRSSFHGNHISYYQEYADLLVAQGHPEIAFQVVERSRARALLETLVEATARVHQGVDAGLVERENILRHSLNVKSDRRIRLLSDAHTEDQERAINREIEELVAQYQDIEGQIRASSPAYASLTQPQPLSGKQVQEQLLDQNTLLLEYSLGDERSYVWAVGSNSLTAYELPKRAQIEIAARHVYRLLAAKNRNSKSETDSRLQARRAKANAEYQRASAELSQMVLGPVAAQLGEKRLLIVNDGALAYIPFAALPAPGVSASSKFVPLMVKHEIVNLPSASVLAVQRQQELGRKKATKSVAVLADPVFNPQDSRVTGKPQRSPTAQKPEESIPVDRLTRSLTDVGLGMHGKIHLLRLPFTRQEAQAILSVTPQGRDMAALDFQANRATASNPALAEYRVVHFATHGLLDSVHPELSGLVLSMVDERGQSRNGFLELQDIYNLNLPVDLVVLSACETGLGKEINGEGLVGLTRGFMYAGAKSVAASLWNVSDVATAKLMARFYAAMEQDEMRPAAALRAAQIQMWKQNRWSSPYYWAAFQIQGDWK